MQIFSNGYALIVGIANYPYVRPLSDAVLNDARDMASLLQLQSHCGYPGANVKMLLDKNADREGILDGFDWLAQNCQQQDTAFIFVSSHGGQIANGEDAGAYLLPYDCRPGKIKQTGISSNELTNFLHKIKSRKIIAFFDFCFSGGAGDPKSLEKSLFDKAGFTPDVYEQLIQGSGKVVIASSRSDEVSYILPGMSNSLFTHYLMEALQGGAYSRGDGVIRIFDVFHYLADNVPLKADQHPWFKAADLENNFAVSLYLGGKEVVSNYRSEIPVPKVDKRVLRDMMIAHFSRDDLADLCVDIEQAITNDGNNLRVSLELAGGNGTLTRQVIDLISYVERRGYLNYLVQAVRSVRPGIACTF